MEDGCYSRANCLLDIVDLAWLTDSLSDDEVELPKDVVLNDEELEGLGHQIQPPPLDRWNDLGFPNLAED